jgi:hypothetical protein
MPGYAIESRNILRTPSTAVLPAWGIGLDVNGRSFVGDPADDKAATAAAYPEVALSLGLFDRLEVGVRMNGAPYQAGVTGDSAVTGQFKALLLEDKGLIPSFAVGMFGIGSEKYPFPDSFAPGEGQDGATMKPEKNSWFAEFGKEVPFLGNLFLGIGGGRFVGHGRYNQDLKGLFGGWRHYVVGPLWGAVEIDGRSANAGLGVSMDIMDKLAITASVRGEYLQHFRSIKDGDDLPAIGAALELVYAPFGMKKDKEAREEPVVEPVKPVPAPAKIKPAKVSATTLSTATAVSSTVAAPKRVVRKKAAVAPAAAPVTAPVAAPATAPVKK